MKTILSLLVLVASLALTSAHAQEAASGKSAPIRTAGEPAKKPAAAAASSAGKIANLTPQNRMKECNKAAAGKKGAERKAFMKSCLSGKG